MRIGVFGGSFDPIHYGHLLLAESCREACRLDEVRLVPAAIPPHKQGRNRAPDAQRLEMLHLAIGGHSAFTVWDVELERGGVSYTVDTLRTLHEQHPEDDLFLLLGADTLHDLPNWRQPSEICQLACLAVAGRPGGGTVDFDVLRDVATPQQIARCREHLVEMPLIELSSSDIRRRVRQQRSIRYRTPRAVEEYIKTADLYR